MVWADTDFTQRAPISRQPVLALDHDRKDTPTVPHERYSTSPLPSAAIVWLLRQRTDTFAQVVVCVESQQASSCW